MKTKDTACSTSKLYIGIDVHKRSWKIHTSTDLFDGSGYSVPPDAFALKKFVDRQYQDYQVYCVYESGCCGFSHHRLFESFGWHSMVTNPADIRRPSKTKFQKTDKIDARLLCRELKDGRLTGIHVPIVEREQLRCLFRRRNELVKQMRKVKTQIWMQLLYLGIKIPPEFDNSHWSHKFRNWLQSLKFNYATMDYCFATRLDTFVFLDKQIRNVSTALRAYCRKQYKKDYYLLRSVPGVGGIVACGIISELGDLRRFKNFKQLASYVGLIPAMRQSGDNCSTMGLTPRANRIIRSYMVEATWQALRTDPVMQSYYRSHAGKDIKRILVKVARKLLSRIHAVIRTEIPYEIGLIS
jgi:transposase